MKLRLKPSTEPANPSNQPVKKHILKTKLTGFSLRTGKPAERTLRRGANDFRQISRRDRHLRPPVQQFLLSRSSATTGDRLLLQPTRVGQCVCDALPGESEPGKERLPRTA